MIFSNDKSLKLENNNPSIIASAINEQHEYEAIAIESRIEPSPKPKDDINLNQCPAYVQVTSPHTEDGGQWRSLKMMYTRWYLNQDSIIITH